MWSIFTRGNTGGGDRPDNLALACDRCNAFKGPNLVSVDLETGKTVPLFNPRRDDWSKHFLAEGGEIIGLTSAGRVTVRLLNMNAPRRIQLREEWFDVGEGWDEPELNGD